MEQYVRKGIQKGEHRFDSAHPHCTHFSRPYHAGLGQRRCHKQLRDIDPYVKVIISSGYSVNRHARESLESGAKDYIDKPLDLKRIHRILHDAF